MNDQPTDGDATGATRREGPGSRPQASDGKHLDKGSSIGRYVIIELLGAGGMGVVYAAFDPELDRKVAIKLLQANAGGSESGGQTWLVREAQAMARLAHPNVVAVYDVGAMSEDQVFVAMELIDGQTLRHWLKTDRTWQEIVPVMRAAGAGLAAAHAAGLVHRDFKPDNVIVGNDGRVRVMDFGLARLQGDPDERGARTSDLSIETRSPLSDRLTQTGTVLGTPAYMAPEIYAAQGADTRADQFAFGVAMYEALYRARPFDRDALVAGKATAPKPPATPKVPLWLETIMLRSIALDPARRYPSMDMLLAELGRERSRRWPLVAAALLVAGGGAAAVFAMRDRTPALEPCSDAPAALARVWDPYARVSLAHSFLTVQKPFVRDAITGTEKAIDTYTGAWVAMRTEACKATRAGGSQSDEVLTLRNQCLDQRLAELSALVGLFAKADEPLVLGGVGAVQKLSPIADCGDVQALLAPDPLPKDPAMRERVAVLQQKLAGARAIYKAGRPKDALVIVQALAPDVAATKHHPTLATLHFLTGQTQWVLAGPQAGEPELQQAVIDAEAGKADETRLEALLQLTNLATDAAKFDVAAERLQQASAALARLGDRWDQKVRVLASSALLESRQNHYDKALVLAKQAREVAHPNTPDAVYAMLVEATISTAAMQPANAVEDFEKVLAYHESFGHDRIEVATVLQSLGTAEMLLGKLDAAQVHLKQALDISEAIYGHESIEVARAMRAVAVVQAAKHDVAGATAQNREALAIISKTIGEDNEDYAAILGTIAGDLIDAGKQAEALPYLDRALKIQTAKVGESHVQTLTLLLTKCDALEAANQHAAALETCLHTVALAEGAFGKTNPLLFLFLAHTGMVQLADQPKAASAMFERAIALGTNDPTDIMYLEFLDAQAKWKLHDKRRALALARTARDGFAKSGPDKAPQLKEVADWLKTHKG